MRITPAIVSWFFLCGTVQARDLPDFSLAGGQRPALTTVINVKKWGLKGNGKTDNSRALQRAVAKFNNAVLFFPAGRYKFSSPIKIEKSNIMLQGEGPAKTVLFFPKPLSQSVGKGEEHAPGGSWSWSGGYISFHGTNKGVFLTDVSEKAQAGAHVIVVDSAANLSPGQKVRLQMTNTNGELDRHIHGNKARPTASLDGKKMVDFSFTIKQVRGNQVTMNRPLRLNVDPEWKPVLLSDLPTVQHVGIENLTIEFPAEPYQGHLKEAGFNAVEFWEVAQGWADNVRIVNADIAFILRSRSKFCTLQNVVIEAEPKREAKGFTGHHGFLVADQSQDNLITKFRFATRYVHDLSVTSMAAGNVFSEGSGKDLSFDHHRKAPYQNLFKDIDAGEGSDVWRSGGDEEAGPPSGAGEAFINIRSQKPIKLPSWAIDFYFK